MQLSVLSCHRMSVSSGLCDYRVTQGTNGPVLWVPYPEKCEFCAHFSFFGDIKGRSPLRG
jgi:hypothetical protein